MDDLNGFINIDKPAGMTSHDVDLILRRILNVEKTGHFGTLDPAVTGVLLIAIGKATRLLQYFEGGKSYVGVIRVHSKVSLNKIKKTIKEKFLGKIRQIPPVKSRVKRIEREREIYKFKILEQRDKNFLFEVSCEAGTYIRKLIHNLGESLGTGAHMTELRRIKAGRFSEKDSITLTELMSVIKNKKLKEYLIPMEIITKEIPKISIKEKTFTRLSHGGPLRKTDFHSLKKFIKGDKLAILFKKNIIEIMVVVDEIGRWAKAETVLV